ncbi:mixed lineage kinase domain-like protein isoform X1 [Branchiostoma lanceolatum]|uniref:mixed lineage kinase domain-like protein isoform X1 n=1 Tax=Branchiostoma lanceolatum TaxID=7740 RepID=UPI0034569810
MSDPISVLSTIFNIYKSIAQIVEEVKCNRKRCKRLKARLDCIVPIAHDVYTQISDEKDKKSYANALEQLLSCLKSAESYIQTFREKMGIVKKVWTRDQVKEDFDALNQRLSDLVPVLTMGLQAETRGTVDAMFNEETRGKEDKEDEKDDWQEMLVLLKKMQTDAEAMKEEMETSFEGINEKLDELDTKMEAKAEKADVVTEKLESVDDKLEELRKGVQTLLVTDSGKPNTHPVDDLKLITKDELKFLKVIEKGSIDTVYKAQYQRTEVAVKKLNVPDNSAESERNVSLVVARELRKEAEIMKKVETENVVRLYGICTDPGNYLIVMEYMMMGSLKTVLKNTGIQLSWKRRIRMALEAARGLYAIHHAKPPMLHMNICSQTFLVDEDLHVKVSQLGNLVSDFGFTKTLSSAGRSGRRRSSLRYVAPEQLANINHPTDYRCEIFALGIVMWEIATRAEPYAGMDDRTIMKYVMKNGTEPVPDGAECPSQYRDIIGDCKQHDPLLRPLTGDIIDRLQILYSFM